MLNNKNKGFSILSIILIIVVVIVAIGVWSMSGQANNNSSNMVDVQISSLVNDSHAIKAEFDRLKIISSNPVNFYPGGTSTLYVSNILDVNNGISDPSVNPKIINNSPSAQEGYWILLRAASVPNVGTAATKATMVVGGIKDSVCKRINLQYNGVSTIPDLGLSANNFLSGWGISNTTPVTSITMYFPNSNPGWTLGCYGSASSPDDNLFFRILEVK